MMEMIMRALMVRIHECRDIMLKYKRPIYGKIQCKVEKRKLKSRDLTGISCPHRVAAIFFQNERIEDYVHAYFKKETFLRTYEALINLMNGPDLWLKIGCDPLLPPKLKRPTGKPSKHRVRDPNEPKNPYKLQRR
ncbi:hypothetical protein ACSBR1_000919 [Camellia fascicularis]